MTVQWLKMDWQAAWAGPWQGIALFGGALLAVALGAGIAERRRNRRHDLDRVGCMPWTMIYVLCFFLGCILLGGAVRTALGSG